MGTGEELMAQQARADTAPSGDALVDEARAWMRDGVKIMVSLLDRLGWNETDHAWYAPNPTAVTIALAEAFATQVKAGTHASTRVTPGDMSVFITSAIPTFVAEIRHLKARVAEYKGIVEAIDADREASTEVVMLARRRAREAENAICRLKQLREQMGTDGKVELVEIFVEIDAILDDAGRGGK